MDNSKDTSVLLVGLGGIGSEIVDSVYGRLKRENRVEKVEAVILDTDVNSQKKLRNIPDDRKIQTSTNNVVKYVLENNPSTKEWFPENPLIEKMQLVNGAGQIRTVSRLALYSAIKDEKLNLFEAVKLSLNKLGSNIEKNGLRVMIVSSLMGGTGSGIFLQIPLYIRDTFENAQNYDKLDIQGTFLLPDVLKGSLMKNMTNNVYANAYASMKELAAINSSVNNYEDAININLEYKPNQINKNNIRDISIKDNPYNYCYFYDKEDTKGRVLGNLEDYKRMVTDNIYNQISGPVSDRIYSNYVNLQKNIVSENGLNIFGGLGIGKLIYPFDDIVDYCVNKALLQSLDNQLLKLDEIYNKAYHRYLKEQDEGNSDGGPKPILSQVYIDHFESLAKEDKYFKKLQKEVVREPIEANDSPQYSYLNIKNKLDENIQNIIDNDKDFEERRSVTRRQQGFMNVSEVQLRNTIRNQENACVEYRSYIDAQAENKAVSRAEANFGLYSEDGYSIFNDYLKPINGSDDGIIMNSVSIRYTLYKLLKEMDREFNDLSSQKEDFENEIKRIEREAFTLKNGKKDDAIHKFDETMNNKGLFGKNLKTFREDYEVHVRKQRNKLDEYCKMKVKYFYYKRFKELLEGLLNEYKLMFDNLTNKRMDVDNNIKILTAKHNDTKGTNYLYVLADSSSKKYIWNSIPEVQKENILSKNLAKEMHDVLFESYKNKALSKLDRKLNYEELFEKIIYSKCREKFLQGDNIDSLVNLNVLSALEKENSFKETGMSNDEYIKSRLNQLTDYISPWCPRSEKSNDYCVWGVSDQCKTWGQEFENKTKLEKLIDELSGTQQHDVVISSRIDEREITYVCARYGLKVNDFAKFSAGNDNRPDGEYYIAYKRMLEDVSHGRQITPHLDKRWDNLLPDINEGINKQKDIDVAKAFIIGLTEKNFKINETDNETKTYKFISYFDGNVSQINYQGKSVDGRFKNLYKALVFNPELVFNANSKFEELCDEARDVANKDIDINDVKFIKSLCKLNVYKFDDVNNILDVFVKLYQENANDLNKSFDEKFNALYDALDDVITEIVRPYCFGQAEITIDNNKKKVYKKLIETSTYYNSMDINTLVYDRIFGKINNILKK